MRTRSKWVMLGGLGITSLALVHCVGDDPSAAPGGGGDDAGSDVTQQGDTVVPPTDGGNPVDAGPDATPICNSLAAGTGITCGAGVDPCIIQISGGEETFCARDTNCHVYCWGANADGQLGTSPVTTPFSAKPLQVDLGGMLDVGVDVSGPPLPDERGDTVVCARVVPALGSTASVMCWGGNEFGQLGIADAGPLVDDAGLPYTSTPTPVAGLGAIGVINVGARHVCATSTAGLLDCWGDNKFGELGRTSTNLTDPTPAAVSVTVANTADVVALNYQATCLVNSTGHVLCAGVNAQGQLGNAAAPNGTNSGAPDLAEVQTSVGPLGSVTQISGNGNTTCAIAAGNVISCWGDNEHGQLGNGTTDVPVSQAFATTPSGLTGISAGNVQAGFRHFCAIYPPTTLADGGTAPNLMCWGDNAGGQTGQPSDGGDVPTPTAVPGLPNGKIIHLAGAGLATCALYQDGTVSCWGQNSLGQLGNRGAGGNDNAILPPGRLTF